uniref:3-oxo-5-alpha-steroid 4-dehydrogenase n=2 Tax=Scleropages formosus TaxID=113540 RepID=A0A8C9QQ53_SCLFO
MNVSRNIDAHICTLFYLAVMLCLSSLILTYCWVLFGMGIVLSIKQTRSREIPYGRYAGKSNSRRFIPAKLAWFLQELPSFLVPMLLVWRSGWRCGMGRMLLLSLFCAHYFQRTFVYSLLTKGRPSPLYIVMSALIFCSVNGFVQGHYLLHCAAYDDSWLTDVRLVTGVTLFLLGMAVNVHSDYILRNLRKPGEITYKIPKGGMFEYVSGANFFGEIIEWFGFAVATWSLPAFAFAFFTLCSIGPRAYNHHRFYHEKFADYPKSRKAVIPFIF